MHTLDTPVRDAMTEPVRTVDGDLSVREVAARLSAERVGSVVVATDPPGIVTKTDVVDGIGDGCDPATTAASELMSRPMITVDADADLGDVIKTMEMHGLRRLPVTSADGIVGIVTTTDLVEALTTDTETVAGVLAVDRAPEPPYTYECADCGHRMTAESKPSKCPECGGRMRNLSVARE
ncbi:MAG: rubrerythrin-like domain-containing protein [Haloplanus sp.]